MKDVSSTHGENLSSTLPETDAPIRSAYHASRTFSGSQMSFGKFVVRSSTSTNSTSFAYKCGLRNDRFDMSESLKCFGLVGSRFSA
jgi:hypothetical protein